MLSSKNLFYSVIYSLFRILKVVILYYDYDYDNYGGYFCLWTIIKKLIDVKYFNW